jgi:hypothetical protein
LSGRRTEATESQVLSRVSGAALILAGLVGGIGVVVLAATANGTALNGAASFAIFVAAPALLFIGFCGMWLHARRTPGSGRLSKTAYVVVALGSIAFAGTAANILTAGNTEGDPSWTVFVLGAGLFIIGLELGALMMTVSGALPRWSTIPLAVVMVGIAGWFISLFTSNAVVLSQGLTALIVVALGGSLVLLGTRVWGIHVIINRTLVYGSLTITLAGLYLGGVIGLQALFRALTGQGSGLAVAISTLAIAALFNPWRHRLQTFIDRHFYRRKYDAARTLADFQSRVRDEVDLDQLTAEVVAVVRETMEPSHVSLWLR